MLAIAAGPLMPATAALVPTVALAEQKVSIKVGEQLTKAQTDQEQEVGPGPQCDQGGAGRHAAH
jgi:hypothetical protein